MEYGARDAKQPGVVATVDEGAKSAPSKDTDDYDPYAKRSERIDNIQNVMLQGRVCRDVWCLIIFILFWGGMIVVAAFGFSQGDPRKYVSHLFYCSYFSRIVYGTDYGGNVCGTNVNPTYNTQNLPGLYWPIFSLSSGLNTSFGICVPQCPTENDIVCMYGVAPNAGNIAAGQCWQGYNSSAGTIEPLVLCVLTLE